MNKAFSNQFLPQTIHVNMWDSYIDPEPENDPARRLLDDLELPGDRFGVSHGGGELDAPHEVGDQDDERREGSAGGAERIVLQNEVEENHSHEAKPRGWLQGEENRVRQRDVE
jgi:hypothetical protein